MQYELRQAAKVAVERAVDALFLLEATGRKPSRHDFMTALEYELFGTSPQHGGADDYTDTRSEAAAYGGK